MHLYDGIEVELPSSPTREKMPVVEHHSKDFQNRQRRAIAQLHDRTNQICIDHGIAEIRANQIDDLVLREPIQVDLTELETLEEPVHLRDFTLSPAGGE